MTKIEQMENSTIPSQQDILNRLEERKDDRPPSEIEAAEQMRAAVQAALDRKAVDVKVLELAEVSDFTDLFLICSGTNERQVQAIADNIEDELRKQQVRPLHVEGQNRARWILMDYGGDMVIHIFHQEARQFYDLERLWSDAPVVTDRFADAAELAASANG